MTPEQLALLSPEARERVEGELKKLQERADAIVMCIEPGCNAMRQQDCSVHARRSEVEK